MNVLSAPKIHFIAILFLTLLTNVTPGQAQTLEMSYADMAHRTIENINSSGGFLDCVVTSQLTTSDKLALTILTDKVRMKSELELTDLTPDQYELMESLKRRENVSSDTYKNGTTDVLKFIYNEQGNIKLVFKMAGNTGITCHSQP